MKGQILGYTILASSYVFGMAVVANQELWVLSIVACMAVLLAFCFGSISLLGTVITLTILNVIFPLCVLFLIGVDAGMEPLVIEVIHQFDWIRAFIPILLSVITYCLLICMKK